MKITQITYSGFGGLGSVVFSLISADKKREHGWSIGFIGDQPLDDAYSTQCDEHEVGYAAFRSTPGRPYRAWQALAQWLAREKPDAVICHSINSVLACRWYAWWSGARLIVVEHTSNQVKTRSEWAASRVSMLLADQVVVLTEEYREELRRAHGWLYRSPKVSVIPNGIDTSLFRPAEAISPRAGRNIRLGMAARFSFSKRQDLLVALMSNLANLRPALSFELRFAGDGDEFHRVQAQAANSPCASDIHFDGLLTEVQVADWLRSIDVYVHATDGETLSTSLLQAMAIGLPIVASEIPGVTNLLGADSEYGLCVPNEASIFAQAIINAIESTQYSKAMAARARARVLEHYSHKVMLQHYLDVISECKKSST